MHLADRVLLFARVPASAATMSDNLGALAEATVVVLRRITFTRTRQAAA